MIFINLFFNYVLIIIFNSFTSLLLVLLLLYIFRVKDSSIRILFLFIPLIKPFLITIESADLNKDYFKYYPMVSGIRFPSPNTFINRFDSINKSPINFSNLNYLIILLIFTCLIIILIIRWIIIYLFYKNLAYEEKVNRNDLPEIFNIIDNYIKKIQIKPPDVSLTYKNFLSPFVIGIKKYTLVLSPTLIENLSFNEKETLIIHELSHVKRRDNLISWFALILRDLLFFNPFAYLSYFLIKLEQEKGSDKLILKFSEMTPREVARNTLNLILKIKYIKSKNSILEVSPSQISTFTTFQKISFKLINIRINSIFKTNPKKIYMKFFPKILMFLLFIILLMIQIVFIIKINDFFLFLR